MTVDQALVQRRTTEIDISQTPVGQFQPLDLYSADTNYREAVSRYEAIATISLGYKASPTAAPRATRREDQKQIHLHDNAGRADGLRARLEASGYRKLMIAFPFDDPNKFIQQRFTWYTASALRAEGNEHGIKEITNRKVMRQKLDRNTGEIVEVEETESEHTYHPAGTERFKALLKYCKVSTSVYFYLAAWDSDGFKVEFPDGMGYYRIRTTSRNSVRTLLAEIREVAKRTHGLIAGIPFELGVDHREVAGPDGSKRTIPVWTAVFKGPPNAGLSSRTFVLTAQDGIEQARMLSLPEPDRETLDDLERGYSEGEFSEAEGDLRPGEILEPTDEELARIKDGGLCDPVQWGRIFFAEVKDSRYDSDEGRAELMLELTEYATSSLAVHLRGMSEKAATEFYLRVRAAVERARREDEPDREARLSAEAAAIFGGPTDDPTPIDWPRDSVADPVIDAAIAEPAAASEAEYYEVGSEPQQPLNVPEQRYGSDPWERDDSDQPTLFTAQATPAREEPSEVADVEAANQLWSDLRTEISRAATAAAIDQFAGQVRLAAMGHQLTQDQEIDLGQLVGEARARLPKAKATAKA